MPSPDFVYLDNHATTRVDPRVMSAMLPYFEDIYGNPHSVHAAGHAARDAVDLARKSIAAGWKCWSQPAYRASWGCWPMKPPT